MNKWLLIGFIKKVLLKEQKESSEKNVAVQNENSVTTEEIKLDEAKPLQSNTPKKVKGATQDMKVKPARCFEEKKCFKRSITARTGH